MVWGRVGQADRSAKLPSCPVSRLHSRPLGQSNTHTELLLSIDAATWADACGVAWGGAG